MYKALITVTPSPQVGTLNYLKWMGGGTGREVKGENCKGVGGRVGGGMVKGQLSHETWWHLGVQGENEESPCSAEWPRIANG